MTQLMESFLINGTPITAMPFGCGHINDTFKITTDTDHTYILQKINKHVFTNPQRLMENVVAVSEFIRRHDPNPQSSLNFIPTTSGERYTIDASGEYWRMYEFADGFCLEAPETSQDFYESAIAFGRFQEQLSDFPADSLFETIPEFHNTRNRYRLLKAALEKDSMGRAQTAQAEIKFIMEREEMGESLQKMRESGELPLRVTHNDTKLNNVLLDSKTRKARCVLDLDTVMPGLSLYDFGDSIRFGAATAAEDEPDLSKMSLRLDLFEIYTKGYVTACPSLTAREKELLPLGAKVITLELAIRFLTDYLEGDHYFKVDYPTHNLVRAKSQLKLVADMESKWEEMQTIVRNITYHPQ